MRIIPVITAILVMLVLYVMTLERERVMSFAASLTAEETATAAPDAPAEAPVETAAVEIAPAIEGPSPVSVRAVVLEASNVNDGVLLRGRTEADRQVNVLAETAGLVISEPLRKGISVDAGAMLCRLDPGTRPAQLAEARAMLAQAKAALPSARAALPEARARVLEAEARLEEARINDNAARQLVQDGFASETRVAATRASVSSAEASVQAATSGVAAAEAGLEAAQASISSAEAAVASVQKDIERLEIRAPFAGLLETDTAELGSLLQPGSLCATVIALDPIKLVGFAPETEVDRIRIGAEAGAQLLSGRQVFGTVSFLSRSADPNTRTFRTEITVPNSDLSIRDGQTVEIGISGGGAKAHLVPQSSLTLDDSGNLGVRTVVEGDNGPEALFRSVQTLRDTPEGVFVAGLPDTVTLITVGQEYVSDGVPVAPSFETDDQELSQ